METVCLSPTILQAYLACVHLNLGDLGMTGQDHTLADSLLDRVINSQSSDSHWVAVADGKLVVQKSGRWFRQVECHITNYITGNKFFS